MNQENLPPGSIVTQPRNAIDQQTPSPKLLKRLPQEGSHEDSTRKIQALANSFTARSLPKHASAGSAATQWDPTFFDPDKKREWCPGQS